MHSEAASQPVARASTRGMSMPGAETIVLGFTALLCCFLVL
jgi:hypothetical protein